MKHKILFFAAAVLIISLISCASAATININSGMTETEIRTLIDGTNANDIVIFADGTYSITNLHINNSVTLRGSGNTVLNGTGGNTITSNSGLIINANNVRIENFNLTNYSAAIRSASTTTSQNVNTVIDNNTLYNNSIGIFITDSDSKIQNNRVQDSTTAAVTDLDFAEGYAITGFSHSNSTANITYLNNTVNKSKYGIANYATNSTIKDNTINLTGYGTLLTRDGIANTLNGTDSVIINNTVSGANARAGIRNDCDSVRIEYNTVFRNMNGINNSDTNHGTSGTGNYVTICNNKIHNNSAFGSGILEKGANATIYDNEIYYNGNGVNVTATGENTVIHSNTIYNNSNVSIYYTGVEGSIYNNAITGNASSVAGISIRSPLLNVNNNRISGFSNTSTDTGIGLLVNFSSYTGDNGDGVGGQYPADGVQLNVFSNDIKDNRLGIDILGENISLGNAAGNDFYNDVSGNVNGVRIRGSNSIFSHLRVFDNGGSGIIIASGNNNTVKTCNLFDNLIGISIESGVTNGIVQFNRFYGNTNFGLDDSGTNTDADYNWWGQNSVDGYNGVSDPASWYAVQLAADTYVAVSDNELLTSPSGNYDLTYSLALYDLLGQIVGDPKDDSGKLPLFNVSVEFDSGTRTIGTVDGDSRLTHMKRMTLNGNNNPIQINAVLDDEDRTLTLQTTDSPTTPGGGSTGNASVGNGTGSANITQGYEEVKKPDEPGPLSASLLIIFLWPIAVATFVFRREQESEN
ncbi:hypothetical protein MmiEs2_05620 [Methanimicrococcus stummii]|uniref:Right handed beta helix domain-containing protein n=1 Tax=Methanimicrococcus stummii TaxID=3028294 RepID=A0AA96V7W9_9EURY|nr:right-handed parallel beta-helix repeat-containing protein [Methanimicrococcus sp. Es2]WNY28377.1 hypothetical protein MmiEs2_05620 [Methanimicrococcus sp. Es2]